MHDKKRFAIRLALEDAGAAVWGYDRTAFGVNIKRGMFPQVCAVAEQNGLQLVDRSLNYFPLGSDNPPDDFRHWCGRYTPANGFHDPGFWLSAKFETINGEAICES